MGFMGHPFIETPNLDALAREGVHFRNAVVTTALCSPSRASILTGLYAHRHRVVDNNNPVPADLVFFPQYLQAAGYQTAFVGKWHMGRDSDEPQRGFDHWVSFRGQGTYFPDGQTLNVDGERVPRRGYITDELTDYAVDWLGRRDRDRPFFLYLSHKAVHSEFVPAERHLGALRGQAGARSAVAGAPAPPATAGRCGSRTSATVGTASSSRTTAGSTSTSTSAATPRPCSRSTTASAACSRPCAPQGVLDSTLVLYMGDNGFAFGEHGLIDKRTAYEESMRIPMLARAPGLLPAGATVDAVVANIDVAPTLLEAAGLEAAARPRRAEPARSPRAAIPRGWRDEVLYEYFWERNFPQTPTMHALRGERYKYIRYHGLWDSDELFDLAGRSRTRCAT